MSDSSEQPETQEANLCRCGSDASPEPHECPFAMEIYGDSRECNCCDGCTHECAMDI